MCISHLPRTDDPDSLPLKYVFEYITEDGLITSINEFSTKPNTSSAMPMGWSDANDVTFGLPLLASAMDVFGGVSSPISTTIRSLPMPASEAVAFIENQTNAISGLLDTGSDEEKKVHRATPANLTNTLAPTPSPTLVPTLAFRYVPPRLHPYLHLRLQRLQSLRPHPFSAMLWIPQTPPMLKPSRRHLRSVGF